MSTQNIVEQIPYAGKSSFAFDHARKQSIQYLKNTGMSNQIKGNSTVLKYYAQDMSKHVTVYSFEVLRTRYVKTGYFFDTNTKELQNSRQLPKHVVFSTQTQSNFKTIDNYNKIHSK